MLSKTDIGKLFAELQARYGHKWTTAYNDPEAMRIAINVWHRDLQGFNPQDLRRALTQWDDVWPPNLPELVKLVVEPHLEDLVPDLQQRIKAHRPRYYFEPTSAAECARRDKADNEATRSVIKQARIDSLALVNAVGLDQAKLDVAQRALEDATVHPLLGRSQ
jgi:hypothetical protein